LKRDRVSQLFVFDPEGELGPKLGALTFGDPKSLLAQLGRGPLIFDPSLSVIRDNREAFHWFSDFAFSVAEKTPGRKIFVVDEAQMWLPSGKPLPVPAAQIFDRGRRYGLDVAIVSQAPQRIHVDARNQFTELVCFRLGDPTSRRWALDFGLSFDPAELRPGEYVSRNLASGGELRGRVF
jgi:DNA helicase HerA-like ATPase